MAKLKICENNCPGTVIALTAISSKEVLQSLVSSWSVVPVVNSRIGKVLVVKRKENLQLEIEKKVVLVVAASVLVVLVVVVVVVLIKVAVVVVVIVVVIQ
ncbi:hypothetical protein ElyMa_005178800 [Elysia marginata]|uniref:Uncharacterized protein n=1 Tax=Elysia marginata TaxID=1093978 RepID=A0AAV4JU50_9GAST|nr:hypothetical protein ElyMa_005178800 [Elysia marginata]